MHNACKSSQTKTHLIKNTANRKRTTKSKLVDGKMWGRLKHSARGARAATARFPKVETEFVEEGDDLKAPLA
jgi:hypothetical protein